MTLSATLRHTRWEVAKIAWTRFSFATIFSMQIGHVQNYDHLHLFLMLFLLHREIIDGGRICPYTQSLLSNAYEVKSRLDGHSNSMELRTDYSSFVLATKTWECIPKFPPNYSRTGDNQPRLPETAECDAFVDLVAPN